MYETCVCSKLCEFISLSSSVFAALDYSIWLQPGGMGQTAFLLWCSLATTATTAVILFKSKTYNLGKGYSTKKSENTGIAKKGGVLTLPRFFCGFDSLKISRMPGRGRPQSFWWTHFEMVEGDFRLVRCLHCQKQVRRGKVGCTSREASNSGMVSHMKSKHPELAALVIFFKN